jgi:hypothetical protein
VWIGQANLDPQTNPISVFFDAALTIPAAQPIRTISGYPANAGTPGRLYVNSDYSIQVQNKNGTVVYSAPVATERYNGSVISTINASQVIYDPAGLGAVATTVQTKLRETVSVKDFGAVGDGVTDNTAVFQLLLDKYIAGEISGIYIPAGDYYFAPSSGNVCLQFLADPVDFQVNPTQLIVYGDGNKSQIIIDNTGADNIWLSGPSGSGLTDYVDNIIFRDFKITSKTISGVSRYSTMTNFGRAFNLARMRRCRFDNLTFYAVLPFFQKNSGETSSALYIQQIDIVGCDSVGHQGAFIDTQGPCYSVNILNNNIEAGNGGIKLGSSSAQSSYKVTIDSNTIQSNGGAFCCMRLNWGLSLQITNNYCESNRTAPGNASVQVFFNNNADASSLILDGNFFAQRASDLDGVGGPYAHVRLDEVQSSQLVRGNTFVGGNGYQLSATSPGNIVSESEIFIPQGSIHSEGAILIGSVGSAQTLNMSTGTWTPVVADAASGGSTGTYTLIGAATFTRVNNLVTVTASLQNVNTSGMTASNELFIRGLPFTSTSGNRSVGAVLLDSVTYTGAYAVAVVGGSASHVGLRAIQNPGVDTIVLVSDVSSGSGDIQFTISYFI